MLCAAANNNGIFMLEFCEIEKLQHNLNRILTLSDFEIIASENEHLTKLKQELEEYFAGKLEAFTVSLSFMGTDFQKKVWEQLLKIPYGTTCTYKEQAIALNNLLAIRAVANANGLNRIAIVVPCHRVIGTNGKLTGYSGGLWRKKWLLNLENEHSSVSGIPDLFNTTFI